RIERARRQPADIAVGLELAPGPAFVGRLVNGNALAHQRFGIEARIVRRPSAHADLWLDHLPERALDEFLRLDLSLQVLGRELRPERIDARIERDHDYPLRMILSENRFPLFGIMLAISLGDQRMQRARRLAFAAFGPARLCGWRPGEDVEMQ